MSRLPLVIVMTLLSLTLGVRATAQPAGGGALPTIAERTQGMAAHPGFINFYWEADAERLWLEVEDWGQEFLYLTQTPSNVEGSNRGSWSGSRIVRFEREGLKVFLIASNYQYRALSDDPLEVRAVTEAYTPPVIQGFRVAAEEEGRVLVDATDFFMRDTRGGGRGGANAAGNLDRARSAFYWPRTKNFETNTEIELTLTFSAGAGETIRLHHSMVELPDDNFEPRLYDPRSGASSVSFTDYASPFTELIRTQYTVRHRLQKRDSAAAVSEVVEPIVYYVDPGAPEPIRSALVDGASWWAEAFEAAGFRNAFRVEVLPGDADPMDLKYNMIFWIHRPERGWSSGSSIRDPRTGEIISGRVFLGSQRMRQDFLIGSGLTALYENGEAETAEVEAMVLARVRQLSAHEVGHTLGFGHNFVASIAGRESVMDYPHPYVEIAADGSLDLSNAYDEGIGEWDKVSIAFAYSQFAPGADERAELHRILDEAHARGMYYLADVGTSSASPETHQWDNGGDTLGEFERVMQVRSIALGNLSANNIRVGDPYARLNEVLVPIYLFHRYQTEALSKSIGGVDYRFAVRGDGQKILEVVDPARQRRALDLLLQTIEPSALAIPRDLLAMLPPRAGGFTRGETFPSRTSPTFDPMAAAETAVGHTMALLLDANRAARLVANRVLVPQAPSLGEVIDTLIDRTWKATPSDDPYLVELQRVAADVTLHHLMLLAADTEALNQVRATAALKIEELRQWVSAQLESVLVVNASNGNGQAAAPPADSGRRAHLYFAAKQIEHYQAEPSQFLATTPLEAPPGAPIGMGEVPLAGLVCDWGWWNR
jgi:hypothetical protein